MLEGIGHKIPLEKRVQGKHGKLHRKDLRIAAKKLAKRVGERFPDPNSAVQSEVIDFALADLIRIANGAEKLAFSYRNFNVGAAVLGVRRRVTEGKTPWKIDFDANTKPNTQSKKYCAEQYLLDRASSPQRSKGLSSILALVISAESQNDADSGKEQMVLTPCKDCRDRLYRLVEEGTGFITGKTQIICVHARYQGIQKRMPVSHLPVFHGEAGSCRTE